MARTWGYVRVSSSAMSAVPSALPSSTTMISKSGVSSEAVFTARITMLAMVPLSLYAGKKTLRPAGFSAGTADMKKPLNHSTKRGSTRRRAPRVSRRDEPPWRDGRFEQHGPGQLRFAQPPLDERDRHFREPQVGGGRRVQHLDQKRITVRCEAGERNGGERLAPPAAITARAV